MCNNSYYILDTDIYMHFEHIYLREVIDKH